MKLPDIQALGESIRNNIRKVVVGKDEVVEQLLIALLASGHVLLEDVPGTGKTLLAKALARSLHCSFKRVQFTPDLLPSDLSGINYYDAKASAFEFRPGPIFTQVLLADEINRATPRTQSSLLECMEERQISIDGQTYKLEQPFLVLATQNPLESQGTFPLPDAQLDRFMLKVHMGYPKREEGLEILRRFRADDPLQTLEPVVKQEDLIAAQQHYTDVIVDDAIYQYILDIVEKTRTHPELLNGVSPRGSLSLLRAAQARAVLQGRTYVQPDDVKAMTLPVLAHRLIPMHRRGLKDRMEVTVLQQILTEVPVPTEPELAPQG